MSEEQRLVNEKDAAKFICVSLSTLRRLKDAGAMPFIRVAARGLRYDIRDLEQFIEQNRQKGKAAGVHAISLH